MDRKKLIKIGEPIRIVRDRMDNPIASYYLVGLTEAACGIALYQYGNEFCTLAFFKDAAGIEILIEHYDEQHFSEGQDITELYKIYGWAFE